MRASSKRAALRSLKRVKVELQERLDFRKKRAPPGSVEMGVAIGLEDGLTGVANEVHRIKSLRTS